MRRIKTYGRQFISAMFLVDSKTTYVPQQTAGLISGTRLFKSCIHTSEIFILGIQEIIFNNEIFKNIHEHVIQIHLNHYFELLKTIKEKHILFTNFSS